jgi:hypothetical protein
VIRHAPKERVWICTIQEPIKNAIIQGHVFCKKQKIIVNTTMGNNIIIHYACVDFQNIIDKNPSPMVFWENPNEMDNFVKFFWNHNSKVIAPIITAPFIKALYWEDVPLMARQALDNFKVDYKKREKLIRFHQLKNIALKLKNAGVSFQGRIGIPQTPVAF